MSARPHTGVQADQRHAKCHAVWLPAAESKAADASPPLTAGEHMLGQATGMLPVCCTGARLPLLSAPGSPCWASCCASSRWRGRGLSPTLTALLVEACAFCLPRHLQQLCVHPISEAAGHSQANHARLCRTGAIGGVERFFGAIKTLAAAAGSAKHRKSAKRPSLHRRLRPAARCRR